MRQSMTDTAALRREVAQLKTQLDRKQAELTQIESACRHDWTPPEKTFDRYTDFEPNFNRAIRQGVHLYYETRAVEKTRPKWTRTCRICGKQETTTRVEEQTEVRQVPRF